MLSEMKRGDDDARMLSSETLECKSEGEVQRDTADDGRRHGEETRKIGWG